MSSPACVSKGTLAFVAVLLRVLHAQQRARGVCKQTSSFMTRTAEAIRDTQVKALTWLFVRQMAAYSTGYLRIHHIRSVMNFPVPKDRHLVLEIRARTFSLLQAEIGDETDPQS